MHYCHYYLYHSNHWCFSSKMSIYPTSAVCLGWFERTPRPLVRTKKLDSCLLEKSGLRLLASELWSGSSLVWTPTAPNHCKCTIYASFSVLVTEVEGYMLWQTKWAARDKHGRTKQKCPLEIWAEEKISHLLEKSTQEHGGAQNLQKNEAE